MDKRLRDLRREWEANPGDQELVAELVAMRRRAGQAVPRKLLNARIHAARTIESPCEAFGYGWEDEEGHAGSWAPLRGGPFELPRHRRWWVSVRAERERWPSTLESLKALAPPGLRLDATQIPMRVLDVGELTFLEDLQLTLPPSEPLEYDAPGRNMGEGEGASLKFLRALNRLERLAVFKVGVGWLPSDFLGVSLFHDTGSDLSRLWPRLVELRLDDHEPDHLFGTDSATNLGRPCLPSLATLPALERLELCGWMWSGNDMTALGGAPALRSLRLEHGGLMSDELTFEHLPALDSLEIVGFYVGVADLERLGKAPAVKRLELGLGFSNDYDPASAARALAGLKALQLDELRLTTCQDPTPWELEVLAQLPLKSLGIEWLSDSKRAEVKAALPACQVRSI